MRAMILERQSPIEETPLREAELPIPEPGLGEIRIRVAACGVCHTDLHEIEGDLPLVRRPVVPGHQIVGRVGATGKGAARFSIDERVGVPWLHSTCGKCKFCQGGRENLCGEARFTGYHVDGGYAEYCTAPEGFAYRIPEGFSDLEAAPLLCAGVIGYRALRLSEVKPGQNLGLYGFGASAHVTIQVALHWGCTAYVFTRRPAHQDLARALGAVWVGSAEHQPPEAIDAAIIFAPAGPLVHNALRATDRGGTIALAGIHMTPIPEMDYSLIYDERTVRTVANSTRKDAEELLALAGRIPIKTEVCAFSLEEANWALQLLKHSGIDGAAVLQIC